MEQFPIDELPHSIITVKLMAGIFPIFHFAERFQIEKPSTANVQCTNANGWNGASLKGNESRVRTTNETEEENEGRKAENVSYGT